MSDQTTNDKKIDKEKTVKKRAARSIVAPRIEEEAVSQGTSRKGTTYIPGTPRPPKQEKKATVIVSPASVHSEPGKTRASKVISAPAGVILNEDKMPPVQKKAKTTVAATGWPERPPTPRVPERNLKPEQTGRLPGTDTAKNAVQNRPAAQVQNTAAEKARVPVKKQPPATPAEKPVTTAAVTGPMPRKMVKTVVTTTTTTYEPVTEEELRQLEAQTLAQTPPQAGQGVQTTVIREFHPQPTSARPAVRQQAARPTQGAPVQGAQRTQGTQPVIRQQAVQGQTVPTQASQQQQQPVRQQAQTPAPQKPLTAMDRQLAEIEKALGLSGDGQTTNAAAPAQNTQVSALNPAVSPGSPGTAPGQPGIPGQPGVPSQPMMDTQTKKTMEYMMLGVEALIFVIVLCVCISIYQKIKNKDYAGGPDEATAYETDAGGTGADHEDDSGTESFDVEEAGADDELSSDSGSSDGGLTLDDGNGADSQMSDSVDVDNDNFALKCTNITVTLDTNGSPAALIYFTFTNKTGEQLSMSEVFPPSVMQNGEPCETFASLEEYPEEFYNKDMKISDGSTINCCYAVALKDAVSPLRLTIHDNYEAFADIGSTEIPIQ